MGLFRHYAASSQAVVGTAAEILGAAGLVDGVTETLRHEFGQAQAGVAGSIAGPMAAAPRPVYDTADQIRMSARYSAGALSVFAQAVSAYNTGIDRLNARWQAFPPVIEPAMAKAKDALLAQLHREQDQLEQALDDRAEEVAGMLDRGPNPGDIAALENRGLMPSESLLLDPSLNPPLVVEVDGQHIVLGTDAADHVQVVVSGGNLIIRVGQLRPDGSIEYQEQVIPADMARDLVIRTGDGDDVIEVPPEARVRITAFSGEGNDLYFGGGQPGVSVGSSGNDRLYLGAGDDVAFGGAGNDAIYGGAGVDTIDGQDGDDLIAGGGGFDTLYGGRGNDRVLGNSGTDYLEGGSGDDSLDGGDGADALSGGRGDDALWGGAGDDALYGGRGADAYDGGAGLDKAAVEDGESQTGTERVITIELTGSPGDHAIELVQPDWMSDAQWHAWLERIDSDLELLRSTPNGRQGLLALDALSEDTDHSWGFWTGDDDRHIRIVPYGNDDEYEGVTVAGWLAGDDLGGNYASPPGGALEDDALVNAGGMHPRALDERPPVVSLYHELSHSFDQIGGGTPDGTFTETIVDEDTGETISQNSADLTEFSAVGQDADGDGDYDPVPTDSGRPHPAALVENALRDDLGWDNREGYTAVPGPGQDLVIEYTDENGDVVRIVVED